MNSVLIRVGKWGMVLDVVFGFGLHGVGCSIKFSWMWCLASLNVVLGLLGRCGVGSPNTTPKANKNKSNIK